MSRCLIIGAGGVLGRRLLDLGHDYEIVDTVCVDADDPRLCNVDLCSLPDIDRCLTNIRAEIVIYAAGLTSVDQCERCPDAAQWANAEVPAHIAKTHKGRTILISTDYVFDGLRGSYSEEDIPRPMNQYGISKLAGEYAVLAARPNNVVLRVSGVFDHNETKEEIFGGRLNFRRSLLRDDNRVSSPVHIEDVKQAISLVIQQPNGGVFHAGGPDALSRYEFGQIVTLHRSNVQRIEPTLYHRTIGAVPRPLNTSLKCEKLNSLGWSPASVATRLTQRVAEIHADGLPDWLPPKVEAILFDCVGALLGPRNWLRTDPAMSELSDRCGSMWNSASIVSEARALSLRRSASDLEDSITQQYGPNPELWHWLPSLASRLRLGLVNNGPSTTFRAWVRRYGLDRIFSVIVNSEELGVRKPQPEFFEYVIRKLGLPAKRCLLLDDDPKNVEGAKHYGMLAMTTIERWSPAVSSFLPANASGGGS